MSGGGGGGGGGGPKVSMDSNLRKTILNIKEITGNHTDEEVYAMLKECAMDPNETTQKLLLQDTFHEVRRKRDKRKENSREQVDPRWRPGVLGRGGRSGRGGYSSRFVSNDAGGGRNVTAGKENGVNQGTDKGNVSSSLPTPDMENKLSTSVSSSVSGIINGPTKADKPTPQEYTVRVSGDKGSAREIKGTGSSSLISANAKTGSASGKPSITSSSISGVYASASDPILVPSIDARVAGAVGAIKREIGSQRMVVDTTANKIPSRDVVGPASLSAKGSPDTGNSCVHEKIQIKSQLFEVKQVSDTSHAVSSSSVSGSGGSRPSSNYSNRSQQLCGSHKVVGSSKEWKPKSAHVNAAQPSGTLGTSDVTPITVEAIDRPLSASSSITSEITTPNLGKKLEDMQLSETHHVIIPHHFQVPESERHGFSFGSFDASFKLGTCVANAPAIEDSSTPPSEISQETEENVDEVSSSIHNESSTAQEEYSPDHPQTPAQMPESLPSRETDVPSGISPAPEVEQSKPEESSASDGSQYSVVQTVPTYSTFGLVPQVLSTQFTPFESTEPQAREATRVPNFVVQQPFDPSTSYYTQIYRPSPDGDGRFSPFLAPGPAAKYNGNIAVLPAHTGLSPQEGGNSMVLSSAGPTLTTQAAGVMQSYIPVTQQPVPVFRQPAGVHMPHFPPNYIPYNQYFSPFYVPPPTLHPFLGNVAFPQQPPTGSIYPPAAAAGAPVKYPISQYKPGTNTANSNHVGIPAYGAYNSSQAGYGPIPAAAGGNSNGADDLTGSQYKENNVYVTGQQQSEGSTVWIPAAGRDISGVPVNSFYSLPQAQHMTFAPTQAGHGALGGIYHPTQAVAAAGVHPLLQQSQTMAGAVEVAGPPAGNYQQQRGQVNWANNY